MADTTPNEAVQELDEIQKLIRVRAYNGATHVRDDMLSFFRALALVLTMTGEGRNARRKERAPSRRY